MTIKQILSAYYASNIFLQAISNAKLKRDFKTWGENNPGYEFIRQIVAKHDHTFHPDSVVYICTLLNVYDLDDLELFLNAMVSVNIPEILSILDVEQDVYIRNMQKMANIDVGSRIQDKIGLNNMTPHFRIALEDAEYQLVPEDQLVDIVMASPVHDYSYVPDSHDCDNYATEFRTWLSKQGYGNISIGYCEYEYSRDGKNYAHAINIALTDAGNVYLIEPQRINKIVNIDHLPFNSYEENFKIRLIRI